MLETQFGQTQPAALSHRVRRHGGGSTCHGAVPACPRRQSWDLGLLCPGGKTTEGLLSEFACSVQFHKRGRVVAAPRLSVIPGKEAVQLASSLHKAHGPPTRADAVHPNIDLAR